LGKEGTEPWKSWEILGILGISGDKLGGRLRREIAEKVRGETGIRVKLPPPVIIDLLFVIKILADLILRE